MLVVNTNVSAIAIQNSLAVNGRVQARTMNALSTGIRINSAADDAAGLAISNKMTSQAMGLNQAVRNANDGISVLQTADGALDEMTNLIQRMREIAVQASNDSNVNNDRLALESEFIALRNAIDDIGSQTQFNGMNILDGSWGVTSNKSLHIGADSTEKIGINIADFRIGNESISSLNSGASITKNSEISVINEGAIMDFQDKVVGGSGDVTQIVFFPYDSGSVTPYAYFYAPGTYTGIERAKAIAEDPSFTTAANSANLDFEQFGSQIVMTPKTSGDTFAISYNNDVATYGQNTLYYQADTITFANVQDTNIVSLNLNP